ncbi:MAG: hypothetical protein ACXADF_08705 [Candidatus Thorarchaeota archaeon]
MTSFSTVLAECPQCSHQWNAPIFRSLCTWLNPKLVKDLYENGSHIECPDCGMSIQVHQNILVNCPKGMFYLDTSEDIFDMRCKLYEWGVVNLDGEVVNSQI